MDRYLNTVIDGRYDIKQVIGTGGKSIVYKAVDLRSGLTVAIKIMRDELSQNMEFRRRFMTESRAVAMLSHKNIVQIFDSLNFELVFDHHAISVPVVWQSLKSERFVKWFFAFVCV